MSSSETRMPTQPQAEIDAGIARCLDALGERDPLTSFREAPARLARAIEGASAALLTKKPAAGGWSAREVLAHLADGEVMLGSRMRLMGAMERPTLVGYDQEAFVARLGVDRRSAAELLEAFRAMRALNVDLLERLPREAWARTGWHTERGEVTIESNLRLYAGHDHVHEAQLARVLAEARRNA